MVSATATRSWSRGPLDAEAAIEAIRARCPDVILMDIQLPGIDITKPIDTRALPETVVRHLANRRAGIVRGQEFS